MPQQTLLKKSQNQLEHWLQQGFPRWHKPANPQMVSVDATAEPFVSWYQLAFKRLIQIINPGFRFGISAHHGSHFEIFYATHFAIANIGMKQIIAISHHSK
jgi:hypothetical protein